MGPFDNTLPIIPNEGLGGVELRRDIRDYQDAFIHMFFCEDKLSYYLLSRVKVVYTLIGLGVEVYVDVREGKIIMIKACEGYQGTLLGKIRVGMRLRDAPKLVPGLHYVLDDDLVYVPGYEGVGLFIGDDVPPDIVPDQYIQSIDVYVPHEERNRRWREL